MSDPKTTNAAGCEWLYSIEGGTFICAECGECYELGEAIPKCPAAANFEKNMQWLKDQST